MTPPPRRNDANRKALRDQWKTDGVKAAKETDKRADNAEKKDDKKKDGDS